MGIDANNIIAVDFVLLPSAEDLMFIKDLNQSLKQPAHKSIHFSNPEIHPHISLLMGGIRIGDLPQLQENLTRISDQTKSFRLNISEISKKTETVSVNFSWDNRLIEFHNLLVEKFAPMVNHKVTEDALFGDEPISESTLTWINSYHRESTNQNFWPHITLGYGELPESANYPKAINCDQFGLFQLGNHCTCRLSLFQSKLHEI